ncbi:NAD-dependent epimerase/dehydratase family protein [Streptomyces sp. NPDC048639]|uniref:NAD-dependent epimerase/dehydratase family protein n=1 Tax=Streptomyces sp. NPDC048639 TaxID=3365581 RepID=UPI0037105DF8
MHNLKVLFIGGTGVISAACAQRAAESGADVHLLNRNSTSHRKTPSGARMLTADVRDAESMRAAVRGHDFDVVVNFLNFTTAHVQADIDLFSGRTGQYVFISSAAVYRTPPGRLPIVESTPLRNPHSAYARNKILCEDLLIRAYREWEFPVTVVRPSHTYDHTAVPFDGGWTVVDRMRRGQEILVHGDGTSLWTLTHHTDFANGFAGLLGNRAALGEAFHITGHEVLTWNQIYGAMAEAAGVEPRLVHLPSDAIAAADRRWGEELLGDKAHSKIFDNAKIRGIVPDFVARVPFSQGAREIVSWYDEDPRRQTIDTRINALTDRLIEAYRPGRV